MATRNTVFIQFGPHLMEAQTLVILDEINILRTKAGLPERTVEQILPALQSKVDGTTDPLISESLESSESPGILKRVWNILTTPI